MQLRHGTAVIHRAPGVIQVGTDWGRELVLRDLTRDHEQWLLALGHAAAISPFPFTGTLAPPPPPAGSLALQIALRNAGYALPRPMRHPRILFNGMESALCPAIDMAISTGTLGLLQILDPRPYGRDMVDVLGPHGIGRTRQAGVTSHFQGLYPWLESSTSPVCDLTIVTRARSLDHGLLGHLLALEEWHLSILIGEQGAIVGPLVIPGRSACARCLALHMSGRDPDLSAAEISAASHPVARLSSAAQARLTLVLTEFFDNFSRFWHLGDHSQKELLPLYNQVSTILPNGRAVQHTLSPHPECGCATESLTRTAQPGEKRGSNRR